ncbi:hypothetical protein H4R34_001078 [Dimargaris verticillata]|uniref:Uncharacterized protein n=1 Tax=Dimargaris verticillata TaxID=2761393 RepID=A0A9W8B961_9FUNG|nr:hypothetical protein H4R34_001078 [Dimargaris verticillata]
MGPRAWPLLGAVLLLCWVCQSWADLKVLDKNVRFRAYDLPNTDQKDLGYDLEGHLLKVDFSDNCRFSFNKSRYQDFFDNYSDIHAAPADQNLIAFVDWDEAVDNGCRQVLDTLIGTGEIEDFTGFSDTSMPRLKAIVYTATTDSNTEFGSPVELEYMYFNEAMPLYPYLMLIGHDDGKQLRTWHDESVQSATKGLLVGIGHSKGPWNGMKEEAGYLVIRWFFFTLRLLAAVYAMYHVVITYYYTRFLYRFKITAHSVIFVHILLLMVAPYEENGTRALVILNAMAMPFLTMTFYLVLTRWARVVRSVYRWRFIRALVWYLRFNVFLIVLGTLFTLLANIRTPSAEVLAAISNAVNNFIVPICYIIEVGIIYAMGSVVIYRQWGYYFSENGALALIKLTVVCFISITGWLILSVLLLVKSTIWEAHFVTDYVVQIALLNTSSVLIAATMLWNLSVASAVKTNTTSRVTDTGRSANLRSGLADPISDPDHPEAKEFGMAHDQLDMVHEKPRILRQEGDFELHELPTSPNSLNYGIGLEPGTPFSPPSTSDPLEGAPSQRRLLP